MTRTTYTCLNSKLEELGEIILEGEFIYPPEHILQVAKGHYPETKYYRIKIINRE